MNHTRKTTKLIGWSLAACLGAAGLAWAAEGTMSKDAYKAAVEKIEAQGKAQRASCGRFKGNAKDVCVAQARGREKVAKAELQARYKPGPESEKLAKIAKADAAYDVTRERCDALRDAAQDRCVQQARQDREAAERLAKVEKVAEINALKRAAREQKDAGQKPAPKS